MPYHGKLKTIAAINPPRILLNPQVPLGPPNGSKILLESLKSALCRQLSKIFGRQNSIEQFKQHLMLAQNRVKLPLYIERLPCSNPVAANHSKTHRKEISILNELLSPIFSLFGEGGLLNLIRSQSKLI